MCSTFNRLGHQPNLGRHPTEESLFHCSATAARPLKEETHSAERMSETFKKGRGPRQADRPSFSASSSSSSSSSAKRQADRHSSSSATSSSSAKPKTWNYAQDVGRGADAESLLPTILIGGIVAIIVYFFFFERRRDRRFALPRLHGHPEPFKSLPEVQRAIREQVRTKQ